MCGTKMIFSFAEELYFYIKRIIIMKSEEHNKFLMRQISYKFTWVKVDILMQFSIFTKWGLWYCFISEWSLHFSIDTDFWIIVTYKSWLIVLRRIFKWFTCYFIDLWFLIFNTIFSWDITGNLTLVKSNFFFQTHFWS